MNPTSHTVGRVSTVSTKEAARVDDLITSTVERLIPAALALNHGIRVTRTGPGTYLVETTADVACGYTVDDHLVEAA